jgi:nitronate monooxygenase
MQALQNPKDADIIALKRVIISTVHTVLSRHLYNAVKGKLSDGYVFVGANAYMADKIRSVHQVISILKKEYALCEIKQK